MKTVLVTGANGFIGKNLCAQLEQEKDLTVLRYGRKNNKKELEEYVNQADFIFHIAGINRPKSEKEFDEGNSGLTKEVLAILKKKNKKIPLLLTSSAQANLDNPYGKSKKAAEDAVFSWAEKIGSKVFVYRLPGVFGKWCKPNYNSVVATFCHNIANGFDIQVNDPKAEVTLVYIDDVVGEFIQAMHDKAHASTDGYYSVAREFTVTLAELAKKLRTFEQSRHDLLVPNFEKPFDRFLYATYLSYLPPKNIGYPLDKKSDERGWLAEFIKSNQFGQIYVSQTNPGFTRGIHWHNTKIEKFLVIGGQAEIKIRNYYSDEVHTFTVSGDTLEVMEMPAGYVHSIKNTGKEIMTLLIWSQNVFDPDNPDTYYKEV